ncbi:DUF4330 domain-containing protein [Peptoniphilus sp. MSJ-1]|uniref:DUF4330 domain-containing protein n=1 Tax=Peptoniphilus ovalis TaxID=2841503 RepID=A0ABS6FL33_9FIRM|nr:DUF4330 family protein [Peptoniphilus ovalis]MBU5670168.1 DUF4330 domain-containing protein [Peptoniphilus ovalis]
MKIIDKRGRLFGLINVIDLVVILLVLALVVVGVKRFGTKAAVGDVSTKQGVVTAEITDIREATVKNIKVGDPIYDYDKGTYLGEIANVEVGPHTDEVEYQGKVVRAEVPDKFRAEIKIKADIKDTKDFYQIGTEQVRVGSQIRIKNKNITTFMTILGIEI